MKRAINIQIETENGAITLIDSFGSTIQLSERESEAMRSLMIEAEMEIKYPSDGRPLQVSPTSESDPSFTPIHEYKPDNEGST